ncbi:MAG: FprA family A-type flavoprotein [Caulobacteraceae bacterium]
MEALKIKENIYWVGARAPELKVFDVIVKTDYGTTYNSYLIKGGKNILVETVEVDFYNEYSRKLEELLGGEAIDYIISNHTEPDHSGALKNLLAKYPGAEVICTKPAYMYLKAMLNQDLKCRTVSDGEEIELGGRRFKFILAPFLHWPDTMFTYLKDEKVLFSGDFLGCHYCPEENKIYNDETGDFNEAFKFYFDSIMAPFKEHVIKGLDKLNDMPVEIVCPSHGPVLRKNIKSYMEKYREWSKDAVRVSDRKYIVIAYVSAYNYTRTIAEKLYEVISESDAVDVDIINIVEHDLMDIKRKIEYSDGVLIGSPTFNQDALRPVWDALSVICPINVRGKLAAAFGSYGWSGEAVKMLEERLRGLKFKVVESGLRFNFVPSDEDLKTTGKFAKKFLEML